jgi:hypothetical protein
MNAPASIKPAGRDRYRLIVEHHCPAISEEELQVRCSILLVRDKATSSLRRCSEEAHGILTEIQRLGDLHAFRSMPLEQLAELRRQMVRLLSCASGLEMFAYEIGGADARG